MSSSSSSTPTLLTRKDGEFLRVIASFSVVIAHCIHCWVEGFHRHPSFASLEFIAMAADQFTRFTVPLFLFLSGFGLTLQIAGRGLDVKKYYRYRLPKILLPFLFWSLLTGFRHVDYFEAMDWERRPFGAVGLILRFLFIDGFDYQYYFLIVIFQFYLLFPLFHKLGRSPRWMAFFLLLHFCFMSPMEFYLGFLGLKVPALHSNFILLNWLWCFAGIHLASYQGHLAGLLRNWSGRKVLAFWALSFGLLNLEFVAQVVEGKNLADVDHFNRWSVILYCFASLLLFTKLKPFIEAHLYPRLSARFLFSHIAPYTFFVYLAHTHLLRGVDFLFFESTWVDMAHRIVLVLGGSYVLAWALQWLLEDFPRLRFYLGLPKKPLAFLPPAPFPARNPRIPAVTAEPADRKAAADSLAA